MFLCDGALNKLGSPHWSVIYIYLQSDCYCCQFVGDDSIVVISFLAIDPNVRVVVVFGHWLGDTTFLCPF